GDRAGWHVRRATPGHAGARAWSRPTYAPVLVRLSSRSLAVRGVVGGTTTRRRSTRAAQRGPRARHAVALAAGRASAQRCGEARRTVNVRQARRALGSHWWWAFLASLAVAIACESTTNLASSREREREGGTPLRDAANDAASDAQAEIVFTDAGTALCG